MNVNYQISNATFDVTITLTEITDDVYNDICKFIEERIAAKHERDIELPAVNHEEVPEEESEEKLEVMSFDTSVIKEIVPEKTQKPTFNRNRQREHFAGLIGDYKTYPKMFKLVEMTSSEYLQKHPEYSDLTSNWISRVMRKNQMPEDVKSMKCETGTYGRYAVFSFPELKRTFGVALREARRDNNLSIGEVSELIGYTSGIIKHWEFGDYTPSSEAIEKLKNIFGEAAFANLDD